MRITPASKLAIVVLFSLALAGGFAIQPNSAQISGAQINKLVASASGVSDYARISSRRLNEQVLVEVKGYDLNNPVLLKSRAFAIGRAVMHADPGYVRGVVTRFTDTSGSSVDLMVTGKDLVSVEAGIDGREKVISAIPMVSLPAGSSTRSRFSGYSDQGGILLKDNELYAAWTFFQWAENQDREYARQDSAFLRRLFGLGRAFDLRGDFNQADDVYNHLLDLLGSGPATDGSANHVQPDSIRQIASYFVGQSQFDKALKAALLLSAYQNSQPFNKRKNFVSDVRLLALCYRKQGKVVDARRELEGALLISRNKRGESNPDVALILEDLGDCYKTEGKKSEALEFYGQAKRKYDTSMAARQSSQRLDFEIYQSAMRRLSDKIKNLKAI